MTTKNEQSERATWTFTLRDGRVVTGTIGFGCPDYVVVHTPGRAPRFVPRALIVDTVRH